MDLPMVENPILTIFLNSDNQTMIVRMNNFKDNMKSSKHVKRRLKSVKKMKNYGLIALDYVETAKRQAHPFTKGLSINMINLASSEMSLRPM
jgi:hypothetical protein